MKVNLSVMLAGCALLSACATKPLPRPVEVHTQTVEVQMRPPCPTPDERARLKQFRPASLAGTPIPATVRERVTKPSRSSTDAKVLVVGQTRSMRR